MATDPTDKLLSALDDAIVLLRQSGEAHWATWLEQDRRLFAKGVYYGVEHLLRAFGGMGSFGDLVLSDPEVDSSLRAVRSC